MSDKRAGMPTPGQEIDISKLDGAARERLIKALARFVLEDLEEGRRKQRQRKVGE